MPVSEISVTPQPGSDAFGVSVDAYIVIRVELRRAYLSTKGLDRFEWFVVSRGDLDNEEHSDMYLDCPARDDNENENKRILDHGAEIFVVPAAYTDQKTARLSKYLTCLILQLEKREAGPVFHRISLTDLSPCGDRRARKEDEILKTRDGDADLVDRVKYDSKTGMHLIRLVRGRRSNRIYSREDSKLEREAQKEGSGDAVPS